MPVSVECIDAHIETHCTRLRRFPAIRDWPRYLIHTAQVEVAAEILRSGYLLPRSQQKMLLHDVANPDAIAINPEALKYARLYFRPKTAYHLKTEGIKFKSDPYRDRRHMSIPVMLAFDCRSVLMMPETGFCSGKLAKLGAQPEVDEAYFRAIPFEDVYHDGPTSSRGEEIQHMRMSEVVYPGPLPIVPHLKYAVCRSGYDRLTLLHLLGDDAERFRKMITTEQTPRSAFIHKALYINNLTFEGSRLMLGLHKSSWRPAGEIFKVRIEQHVGREILKARDIDWPVAYQSGTVSGYGDAAGAVWKIFVEGVIAFHSVLPAGKVF